MDDNAMEMAEREIDRLEAEVERLRAALAKIASMSMPWSPEGQNLAVDIASKALEGGEQ